MLGFFCEFVILLEIVKVDDRGEIELVNPIQQEETMVQVSLSTNNGERRNKQIYSARDNSNMLGHS